MAPASAGNGEQHRVSRRLEGAEDHRHQTEFGLVTVFAGGGLPNIGRLWVVLIPHLAPQRTPGDVRIRVVERIALPALRALQQQAIAARRERHLPHLGAQTGIQQRLRLNGGEQREAAIGPQGGEHPAIGLSHRQLLPVGAMVEMLHRRQAPALLFSTSNHSRRLPSAPLISSALPPGSAVI